MKIKFKYLVNDRRGARDRFYVRKTGHPKIRIRETPGSPAFVLAYNAAILQLAKTPGKTAGKFPTGTLGWLLHRYSESAELCALSPLTIKERRNIYGRITRAYGGLFVHAITQNDIYALRDAQADTPAMANKFVKCLRYAFKWGCRHSLIDGNPARDVALLPVRSAGFVPLTSEDVAAYIATHPIGSRAYLAFMIAATINGRRADIAKIGPQHISNGWVRYVQDKNDATNPARIEVPLSPFLQQAIAATKTGDLTLLITERGKPFSIGGLGNKFKKWLSDAGIDAPGKNTHGIRKAFASWAAESGATDEELMAGFGWRSRNQVSTYTKSAERAKLAQKVSATTNEKLSHFVESETVSESQLIDFKHKIQSSGRPGRT